MFIEKTKEETKADVSYDIFSKSWARQPCSKSGNTYFVLSKQNIQLLKVGGMLN